MNAAVQHRIRWIRRIFDERKRRFIEELDDERIATFQRFVYPIIVIAGLYTWLGADHQQTIALSETLGTPVFVGWVALNIVCPFLTLIGRRLTKQAAGANEGDPNSSVGGAGLQLVGDGGVWGAVMIYFACIANTYYWGQPLYTSFFFLMAVPVGFLFTYRSWRRLRQITQRAKHMS